MFRLVASATSNPSLGADRTAILMLVVALVHSQLDYGNSVLVRLSAYLLYVSSSRSWTQPPVTVWCIMWELSTTDALISLQSIAGCRKDTVKMAVLAYKALHGGSPRYRSSLVHVADVSGRPASCRVEPFAADSAIQTVNHRRSSVSVAAAK